MEFRSYDDMLEALSGLATDRIDTMEESNEKPEKKIEEPKKEKKEGYKLSAMPSAVKFAQQHRIDLSTVKGTGKGGRITLANVKKVHEAMQAQGRELEQDPETQDTVEPKETSEPPSLEEVREALSHLNSEKGLPSARDILARYGCAKVSEIPEERRDEFITECNTIAAGDEDEPDGQILE